MNSTTDMATEQANVLAQMGRLLRQKQLDELALSLKALRTFLNDLERTIQLAEVVRLVPRGDNGAPPSDKATKHEREK